MATVGIDAQTGSFVVNGQKVFPLGLSDAPPVGTTVPVTGQDAIEVITKIESLAGSR